ncbi:MULTISPECIES: hypothetical protein [unclassified Bifidobacterium]|nr:MULTISPECIES: hypothetical protein [unclassified Bifidobacterium]
MSDVTFRNGAAVTLDMAWSECAFRLTAAPIEQVARIEMKARQR